MTKKLDPYAELGVDRFATPAQVKKAFREKSKKAHPDSGGSADDFERLKRCQLVLMDPDRREKYDRTGDIDEPNINGPEAEARGIIAEVLKMFIDGDRDPTTVDLIATMKEYFAKQIANIQNEIDVTEKTIKRVNKMAGRFKRKTKGANMFQLMLKHKASSYEEGIRGARRKMESFKLALLLTAEYDFDVDYTAAQMTTIRVGPVKTSTGGWR